ncbi:MAG: pyrroloquinoline quinone-dependent dehydrogenase [Gammaproteobacteria bacterium]|jgi:quinoprotein glucose dehydrogenase|nr:pyrroloquinoline quinone-dependent dehydrogenase [Gammaproteobacteria bacterium]
MRLTSLIISVLIFVGFNSARAGEWPVHSGDKQGTRYSSLNQINRKNVDELEVAWVYSSGELRRHPDKITQSVEQNIPILSAGNLVVCSPFNRVIALDPEQGKEKWVFDPEVSMNLGKDSQYTCRGVAQWVDDSNIESHDDSDAENSTCSTRIIFGTVDLRIFALDAKTGQRCADFGENGVVQSKPDKEQTYPGEIQYLMPPAIIGDVAVFGSALPDYGRADGMSGKVLAIDVRKGRKLWEFNTIPTTADDPAMDSWEGEGASKTGGGNVWGNISVDEQRDLVFLPVSSATADTYGGHRPGNNLYTDSLVAVRGSTGQIVWHYQIVHHDLWGWDIAPQPLLVDLMIDGNLIPAVVQNTKQGLIFVLNRETGKPVFPVEERAVPEGDVAGEWYSPTQPFPTLPQPLIEPGFGPEDAWGFTFYDRNKCRDTIAALDYGSLYTPPSEKGALMFPWSGGGANWGGPAYEPGRQSMIINITRVVARIKLIPTQPDGSEIHDYNPIDVSTTAMTGTPYTVEKAFVMSPFGAPCNSPPWGELISVNLASGLIEWRVPLGSIEKQLPIPIPLEWGVPNFGGPIVTAGGLIFIAATIDQKFRAFDIDNGKKLWQTKLPAGAQTAPITYQLNGRQYVVITAGGHKNLGNKRGDFVVAYSLPQ